MKKILKKIYKAILTHEVLEYRGTIEAGLAAVPNNTTDASHAVWNLLK